jgi:hypothetical protein
MFVISLDKEEHKHIHVWSRELLGAVSSEDKVPDILVELACEKLPELARLVDSMDLLLQVRESFLNRTDFSSYIFEAQAEGKAYAQFVVNYVEVLD